MSHQKNLYSCLIIYADRSFWVFGTSSVTLRTDPVFSLATMLVTGLNPISSAKKLNVFSEQKVW